MIINSIYYHNNAIYYYNNNAIYGIYYHNHVIYYHDASDKKRFCLAVWYSSGDKTLSFAKDKIENILVLLRVEHVPGLDHARRLLCVCSVTVKQRLRNFL